MKKAVVFALVLVMALSVVGCSHGTPLAPESVSPGGDYPAAIMVDGAVYTKAYETAGEVDESAIIGETGGYTDAYPTKDFQTNFSREAGLPVAKVDGGVAVLYNNEWQLFTVNGDVEIEHDRLPSVMVDGVLYLDTGRVSDALRCGVMDGEITSTVDSSEVPTEDNQSNFGTGFGYQYGPEGTIEVCITEKWCIFAAEGRILFSDPWSTTLTLENVTPIGLTLTVTQEGGAPTGELSFGPEFAVGKLIDGTWEAMAIPLEGGVSWNDIAYMLPLGGSVEQNINWEHIHGELETGTYRIRKRIMDLRGPGDYDEELYYAEFTIEEAKYEKVSSLKKMDSADVNALVKFDGAVYAQSYAVIDYSGSDEMLGQINMLTDSGLVPYWHGETNSEELLHAVVCEHTGENIILCVDGDYRLFEKVK